LLLKLYYTKLKQLLQKEKLKFKTHLFWVDLSFF
jgi:hypothetical protein